VADNSGNEESVIRKVVIYRWKSKKSM
jgi:hypothetical protein